MRALNSATSRGVRSKAGSRVREDNYADVCAVNVSGERQATSVAVSSATCCQKYIRRSPRAPAIAEGGNPGARSGKPAWGHPGHSPWTPEHLTPVAVICHVRQRAASGRSEEKRREGRDTSAQLSAGGLAVALQATAGPLGDRATLADHKSVTPPSCRAAQRAVALTQVERSTPL